MTLALFDLDNTLIAGDSDHAWGEFVVEKGLVDAENFAETNDHFYQDYVSGTLDIAAYLRFALEPLSQYSMAELSEYHREFMAKKIAPIWLSAAEQLVTKHRNLGHRLVVITATNRFVVEPIIHKFGIDEILCSEPEIHQGRYTGDFVEEPCFNTGKVSKLKRWLASANEDIEGAYFYSDSFNDLPLLEMVDNPVAVNPDATLETRAKNSAWEILDLRG